MANYRDLRDAFTRTLWDAAEGLRNETWESHKRLTLINALVAITCEPEPLMNAAQARRVRLVGDETVRLLEEQEEFSGEDEEGCYASAALCMLRALLELSSEEEEEQEEERLVPMADFLEVAGRYLESSRRFAPLAQIVSQPGCCLAFAQLRPLETREWIKRRHRKAWEGGLGFQLTRKGRQEAAKLLASSRDQRSSGPLHSWGGEDEELVLMVDEREGGGDKDGGLELMCRYLRDERIAYRTHRLRRGLGDFVFLKNTASFDESKIAPLIVERKEVRDLADSLRDGRWEKQHDAMLKTSGGTMRVVYVLEGDSRRHVQTACGCGCRGVGKCGNPTVEACEAAVEKRRLKRDVEIVLTKDLRDTVRWLKTQHDLLITREQHQPAPTKLQEEPKKKEKKKKAPEKSTADVTSAEAAMWARGDADELAKLPGSRLKLLCTRTAQATAGNKREVAERLALASREPPPYLLAKRKAKTGDTAYIPHDRTCAFALLATMDSLLPGAFLAKDELVSAAERSGIATVSLYDSSNNGFDGWSCMTKLCTMSPPLVQKVKGSRYVLTTLGDTEDTGVAVAAALHAKAHSRGWCTCARPPPLNESTRPMTAEDLCPKKKKKKVTDYFSNNPAPLPVAKRGVRAAPSTPPKKPRRDDDDQTPATAPKQRPPTPTAQRPRAQRLSFKDDDDDDDVLGFDPFAAAPKPPQPAPAPAPAPAQPDTAQQQAPPEVHSPPPDGPDDDSDDDDSDGSSVVDLTSPDDRRRQQPPPSSPDVFDLT